MSVMRMIMNHSATPQCTRFPYWRFVKSACRLPLSTGQDDGPKQISVASETLASAPLTLATLHTTRRLQPGFHGDAAPALSPSIYSLTGPSARWRGRGRPGGGRGAGLAVAAYPPATPQNVHSLKSNNGWFFFVRGQENCL